MKYEYLDHTADLKIRAYGNTLEEAFVNTAVGGFDFLTDTKKVKKKIEKKLELKANRLESLLYDFLEQLLFLLDTEGYILAEIKDLKITEEKTSESSKAKPLSAKDKSLSNSSKMNISEDKNNKKFSLQCIVLGDNYENYEVKGNIKSVTYSEMSIKKDKGNYVIEVVLDI
ncbi:archease [Candidatus Woesearchaeota archaeon]|nr:archease [Candidatus Woesearchaeota archaeon]